REGTRGPPLAPSYGTGEARSTGEDGARAARRRPRGFAGTALRSDVRGEAAFDEEPLAVHPAQAVLVVAGDGDAAAGDHHQVGAHARGIAVHLDEQVAREVARAKRRAVAERGRDRGAALVGE